MVRKLEAVDRGREAVRQRDVDPALRARRIARLGRTARVGLLALAAIAAVLLAIAMLGPAHKLSCDARDCFQQR